MKQTDSESIIKNLYPLVEKALSKGTIKFKNTISKFINERNKSLFDTCPCDRIYYGENDASEMYRTLGINKHDITTAIKGTYYFSISAFNPRAAKDELTCLMMCVVRYFYKKNDKQNLDLAMIYLSFSGKFYPSIHYMSFPKVQPSEYRYVMEYVLNNMVNNKFDLKTQGSVLGAIKSIDNTWVNSYTDLFNSFSDEDIVYLIQQLHNRIKSFMKNIASLYYDAYENKDYMTYDSDALGDVSQGEKYHIADNDSLKAERYVEKAIEKIVTTSVDYKICKMSADNLVRTEEVKGIIEAILNGKENIPLVKELVRILVYTYFEQSNTKDVTDIAFITFSVAPKPNTKDPHILRSKAIVEGWLEDNSINYRKRKRRIATKNSYNRSVLMYFTLMIHISNK